MKINELLTESPLPSDWDVDIYDPRVPFAQRVRYAQERATKIGTGSSRIAFEIPYQGRSTVLKIAKNAKGMAQNDFESQMMSDWYLKDYNILVPMIDYDERSASPTWIHMERAQKATQNIFRQVSGGYSFDDVWRFALYATGKNRHVSGPMGPFLELSAKQDADELPEFVEGLIALIGNYDIAWNDLNRLANWGIYQNRPVIVDIGASTEIIKTMYR